MSRGAKPAPQQPMNQQQNNQAAGNMQFAKPAGADAANSNGATMPTGQNADFGNPNDQSNQQQQKANDPLAPFGKMFDNNENTDKAPNFTMDDKILGDVAKSQDFMRGVDPSLVQRATSGDTVALMQMMNEVGRNAYKASLSHAGKLTESFVSAREGYNEKGFSNKVRGELTVNALTGTPNFKNPVVRKQLTMIADNLQKQHPDAPPEEIAQMSRDYITELSKAIAPASKEDSSQTGRNKQPTDFAAWFDQEDASAGY